MLPSTPCLAGLVSAVCILGATAEGALTPYTASGKPVVYSSKSDITWTGNANLLGDWIASAGTQAVFDAISAVSPTVTANYNFSGPDTHTLTPGDYFGDGSATFYGAYAYINYLNSISYAGTNQWRLPDAINSVYPNPFPNSYTKAGDFGQLFYDEFESPAAVNITVDPQNLFTNEQYIWYWSFELITYQFGPNSFYDVTQPYGFHMGRGDQYFLNPSFNYFVWPVTNGMIPEPASLSLLAGAAILMRRRQRS